MELIIIIVGLIGAGLLIARHFRMRAAMKEDISDRTCVSCGSTIVETIAPDVYRCMQCGYEGGSGMAAVHQQAREQNIRSMDPVLRWQSGLADLKDAKALLIGVDGTIQHALSASRLDLVGLRGGGFGDGAESSEKHQQLASAMTDVLKAQQHIKDAALKLGEDDMVVEEFDIDFTRASFALDVQFDSVFFDLKVHGKIKDLKRHAEGMLAAVEEALTKLENAPQPPR